MEKVTHTLSSNLTHTLSVYLSHTHSLSISHTHSLCPSHTVTYESGKGRNRECVRERVCSCVIIEKKCVWDKEKDEHAA